MGGNRRRPAGPAGLGHGPTGWALWALAILGHVAMLWLDHLLRQADRPDLAQVLPLLPHYLVGVGAATVGALLANRRPRHPVGWLLLVFGLASAVSGVAAGYTYYLVATRPGDEVAAGTAALFAQLSFYPIPVAMSFIMLLTPTGSLPSPRWRWLAVTVLVAPVVTGLADSFSSHPLLDPPAPPLMSPLAVPALAGPLEVVGTAASIVIALAALAAAGSLVVRFRRAGGTERQQLRWLALAVTTVVPVGVLVAIVAPNPVSAWGTGIAVLGVQLAIYAAIVRYRLYDLDRIISRTLAWGLLTLLLGGGYAAVVLGLGQLLGRDSSLVVAAATLAAAALFQPARHRIQQAVDRRFNRRRHDAARAIAAFNDRLRQHIDLDTLTPRWSEGCLAIEADGHQMATLGRCSMFLEDNKAVIRAYVEAVWNEKQLDRAGDVVASDFLDYAPLPGQAPGLEGAKRKWGMFLTAVPDLRVAIEDLVAEGDKVAVRRTYAGTHQGELLGIPATGKQVRVGSISIFRLAEGKIADSWEQWDRLGLLQQLGVIPAPAAPAAPTG